MGIKLRQGNPKLIASGERSVAIVREWCAEKGEAANGMKLPEIAAAVKLSQGQVRRALKIINGEALK